MKNKLTKGVLGLAGLLIASQANSGTVSMVIDPLSASVGLGDSVSISIVGSDFADGVSGGGVTLTWSSSLQLVTTENDFILGFPTDPNGPGFFNLSFAETADPLNNSGSVTITEGSFGALGVGGTQFTLATLAFIASPPPGTSNIEIGLGTGGPWQDGNGVAIDETTITYNTTAVTVGAVPVPAAVWLFGSGLIGLVGVARRRSPQLV